MTLERSVTVEPQGRGRQSNCLSSKREGESIAPKGKDDAKEEDEGRAGEGDSDRTRNAVVHFLLLEEGKV